MAHGNEDGRLMEDLKKQRCDCMEQYGQYSAPLSCRDCCHSPGSMGCRIQSRGSEKGEEEGFFLKMTNRHDPVLP